MQTDNKIGEPETVDNKNEADPFILWNREQNQNREAESIARAIYNGPIRDAISGLDETMKKEVTNLLITTLRGYLIGLNKEV
jgi:hypothetical protein